MNNVQLVGRVGLDPKVSETENGRKVARVSLATTERGFTTKSGKKVEDRTEWHNLIFFGNICTVLEKYVKTGALIGVKGSIHYSKWEDAEKNTKYMTEIWCSDLELLSKRESEESGEVMQYKSRSEEDLPF